MILATFEPVPRGRRHSGHRRQPGLQRQEEQKRGCRDGKPLSGVPAGASMDTCISLSRCTLRCDNQYRRNRAGCGVCLRKRVFSSVIQDLLGPRGSRPGAPGALHPQGSRRARLRLCVVGGPSKGTEAAAASLGPALPHSVTTVNRQAAKRPGNGISSRQMWFRSM